MSRVLFDKNVPYPLKKHLAGYVVQTAEAEGWGQIANGELIRRAEEADFHILLTCDQNLRYQQNIANRSISMIVRGSNIWSGVESKIEDIRKGLQGASPGSFEFIEIPAPPKRRRLTGPEL